MRVEVDGQTVEVEPGATILDAATAAGRYVPTLCFDERMAPFGACRVCMVGMEGAGAPVAACTTPCRDDMQVRTDDATARKVYERAQKIVWEDAPLGFLYFQPDIVAYSKKLHGFGPRLDEYVDVRNVRIE